MADFNVDSLTTDLIEFALREVLESFDGKRTGMLPDEIRWIETFEEAGLLTSDHGLVLKMKDGSQFQLTIVQSRRGN